MGGGKREEVNESREGMQFPTTYDHEKEKGGKEGREKKKDKRCRHQKDGETKVRERDGMQFSSMTQM